MRRIAFVQAFWCTFFLVCTLALPCLAVPGDCNGNGSVDVDDAVSVIVYYFNGGPPPSNPSDCDCDGFPGVNFGDAQQITSFLFSSGLLYASPGSDVMISADTRISIVGQPGQPPTVPPNPPPPFVTRTSIYINNPTYLAGGMMLPFSFAPDLGEADLICTGVTVGPLFASTVGADVDNVIQSFRLRATQGVATTSGWELLCTADFALDPGGTGTGLPVCVDPAAIGPTSPLLLSAMAYTGVDRQRVMFPRFGDIPGDADCNGIVNISDAVYLIVFIFAGGPPPGCPCP